MRLLLFTTATRGPEVGEAHEEMVRAMRTLAEETPGFVAWHDIVGTEPGTASGVIVFESEEALSRWRDHPSHGAVHRQGEESVYRSFRVQIFELVRENTWGLDDAG